MPDVQPLNQLHCFQQHNSTATPPTIRAYYSLVVSAYFPKLNTELRKYPPILCSDFIQKQAWERTHPFKNCVIPSVPYYTHIHTYTYSTYIRKYIHTYVHIYIYTYIRIYIHTYVHTYIHTFFWPFFYVWEIFFCCASFGGLCPVSSLRHIHDPVLLSQDRNYTCFFSTVIAQTNPPKKQLG